MAGAREFINAFGAIDDGGFEWTCKLVAVGLRTIISATASDTVIAVTSCPGIGGTSSFRHVVRRDFDGVLLGNNPH